MNWHPFLLALVLVPAAMGEDWANWRGPRLDGSSHETNVPLYWNAASNILWKTELPGLGHASPIVCRDKVFVVSADTDEQKRLLLSLEASTGTILWKRTVLSSPLEHKNSLNSYASSTPAADGTSVFVAFLDRDQMFVAAYGFEGNRQWEVRPGPFSSIHGFCSSSLLFKDKVILNGDHDGDSYLVALSRTDGHTVWKTARQNHTRSYCVPLIREIAGRMQMVLVGDKCVASYDPETGKQYWVIQGPTEQFVASPVYHEPSGLVLITGGFPEHHILAIRPDGNGDVTDTHIAWRTTEGAAYVPSPIIERDYFLIVSDGGVAHCFEAKSGKLIWKQRLGEEHASLVSAEGHVYFLNDKGTMNVVKVGTEFVRLAQNDIGEKCFASPAISDGRIFLRSEKHLWCIGSR